MNRKRKKETTWKQIMLYAWMLILLFTLVTAATYSWFSISATPRVSDLNMYVNAPKGLEISLDPRAEDWQLQVDLRDAIPVTTPLRPITWVDEEQCFYSIAYTPDGRMRPLEYWEPLSDAVNANKDNLDGYYITFSIYLRSDTPVDVSLSPAVEIDEGIHGHGTYLIGTPIWNAEEILHNNGGKGAETAVRIGLRITPVDSLGQSTGEEPSFYIYEPNGDSHIDGSDGYVNTPSVTGAEHLVAEEFLIRQTTSTWTEANPVERDVTIKDLGEFESDPELFSLQANEMVKIDIYVWLEGQDKDCTSLIQNAQILASLQFAAEPGNHSGMTPVDKND